MSPACIIPLMEVWERLWNNVGKHRAWWPTLWVEGVGWGMAALLLGVLVFLWSLRSWAVVRFPYQVEYGEGPVVDWTLALLRGRWPYKPIQPPPWTLSVYTPGYLVMAAALTPAVERLGLPLWAAGRLLSLVSALGLAVLAGTMVRALTGRRWLAVVAALVWITAPLLHRWATLYRVDIFALWWSALGIALVGRAQGRARWLVLAGLAFLAGMFTKQSFVAAPLAAALYLGWRDRRAAVILVSTFVVVGGMVGVGLWWQVGNGLIESLLVANANSFSVKRMLGLQWTAFLRLVPVFLVLAGVAVRTFNVPLVGLWWLLAVLMTVSAGKVGAWENYFLEPLFTTIVLGVAMLSRWPREWRVLVPWIFVVQLFLYVFGIEHASPATFWRWLGDLAAEEQALADFVERTPDPILSEHMGVLAQARRPIWLHSFVYTQLERQGAFDPGELLGMISRGEFALVIENEGAKRRKDVGRWSQRVLNAIDAAYAPVERVGRWLILRPAPLRRSANVPVGPSIRLQQWDVAVNGVVAPPGPVAIRPGDRLEVHLLWEAVDRPRETLTAFVHLKNWLGEGITQHDAPPREGTMPTNTWRPGDLVRDVHPLQVPADVTPGAYVLDVGLYTLGASGEVQPAGPPVRLEGLKVPLEFPPPPSTTPLARVGNVLVLVSVTTPTMPLRPGQEVNVKTIWRAENLPAGDWTAFLHLIGPCADEACQLPPLAQDDHRPLDGRYPTSVWSPGEYVPVDFRLVVPSEVPPGEYRLRLGWYPVEGGPRLPVAEATFPVVDNALDVMTFQVARP
ncbi:MAG: hypothetical protein Q9O62_02575 [Ardenticatenia bacterium]|nr:hypothetical protein [Ardenticatenia bacterium]